MSGLRASMRLYGLVKNSGSTDNPQRQPVDILCMTNRTGGTAIRAFVSCLDAELMTRSAGLDGYRVIPLRTFDPTAFIDAHQGWLMLHICCGFVAPVGHSLLKDDAPGSTSWTMRRLPSWRGTSMKPGDICKPLQPQTAVSIATHCSTPSTTAGASPRPTSISISRIRNL